MLSCAAMAPIAQHRGGDAQLACDLDQRPTAARQQGDRLPLELIRKMTPFLIHSTPFRSRRSLAKVSTNSGEAQVSNKAMALLRPFALPVNSPLPCSWQLHSPLAQADNKRLLPYHLRLGSRRDFVSHAAKFRSQRTE